MSCLNLFLSVIVFMVPGISPGQLIFYKSFRDSAYSNHVFLSPDNKVYLSGFKNNAMLVKSDSLGNKLWAMEYYRPFDNTLIRDMIDNDAMILVAGTTDDTIKPTPSQNSTNLFLMNVDTGTGNIINSVILGDSLYDYIGAIKKTSDGNFITVGIVNNGPLSYSPSEGLVMKFDNNLNTIWSKRYVSGYVTAFRDILESDSGHFYITGSINYAQWDSNQALLVKIDSAGNLIWAKSYRDGANDLPGMSIHQNGGNLLITGLNRDWNQATFFGDFAMNVNPFGNLIWVNRITSTVSLHGGFSKKKNNNEFIIGSSKNIYGFDSSGTIVFGKKITKNGSFINLHLTKDNGFYASGAGTFQLIRSDSSYSFCYETSVNYFTTPLTAIADSTVSLISSAYIPPFKGTIYQRSVYTHDTLYCMTTTDVPASPLEQSQYVTLKIFPNPFKNKIYCLFSNPLSGYERKIFQLYSPLGVLVMSIPVTQNSLTEISIDPTLNPGVYFANIADKPGIVIKLILMK